MNAGECVRRLFFVIFAPDSQQESSPLSGRKSTQATVRICGASSEIEVYLAYQAQLRDALELRHNAPDMRFMNVSQVTEADVARAEASARDGKRRNFGTI
ncbi:MULTISPECIES: NEL domain-containing protein [Bradyrhizobium]|uniref:NEL domain-containing protein n=1 Tax=Bradyrhizobium TaxID=374 RepID=UPI0020110472|nr:MULTISPECIES: NEL domain-containing protein [Bradyrhizobium]WLB96342.1 NEL domain-containing protein [Bradyrhizobium japonicum USDA 123]